MNVKSLLLDNDILNKCYTDGTGEEYPNRVWIFKS